MIAERKSIERIRQKGCMVDGQFGRAKELGIPMLLTVGELPEIRRDNLSSVIEIIRSLMKGGSPEADMTTISYDGDYQIRWPGGSLSIRPQPQKEDPNIIKGVEAHLVDTSPAARVRERRIKDLLADPHSLHFQTRVLEPLVNLFLPFEDCVGRDTLWERAHRSCSAQA